MSRWFRHYAGMARDDKLVSAAIKSGQSIERVVWFWGAVLESAAEIDDAGQYQIDHAEMAWFLRCDASDLAAIEDALGVLGRVDQGRVARWSDRQFQSDRSAERQKRYRDRKKEGGDHNDDHDSGELVASPSRHGDAPETETETETEKKERGPVASQPRAEALPSAPASDFPTKAFEDHFWPAYPNKKGKDAAGRKFEAIRRSGKTTFEAIMAGLEQYRRSKPPDRDWCHPLTWLNQGRWNDEWTADDQRNCNDRSSKPRSGNDAIMAAGAEEIERLRRHSGRLDTGADLGSGPILDLDADGSYRYAARGH